MIISALAAQHQFDCCCGMSVTLVCVFGLPEGADDSPPDGSGDSMPCCPPPPLDAEGDELGDAPGPLQPFLEQLQEQLARSEARNRTKSAVFTVASLDP
jgi:hypothetical protein